VEDNRVDELLGRTANLHINVHILKLENKYWLQSIHGLIKRQRQRRNNDPYEDYTLSLE